MDQRQLDGVSDVWCVKTGESLVAPEGRPAGQAGIADFFEVRSARLTLDGMTVLRAMPPSVSGIAAVVEFLVCECNGGEHHVLLHDVEGRTNDLKHDLGDGDAHSGAVAAATLSWDCRLLASGSDDRTVKVWDLADDACTATLVGHSAAVGAVAFFPDGTRIVSGSDDRTIKLWDVASGACLRTLADSSGTSALAVFPSGSRFVSGSRDGSVKVWDARHFRRVPHCLIRHRVRASLATPLSAGLKEKEERLYFFVYCRKNPVDEGRSSWKVLPHGVFPRVCKFLVG